METVEERLADHIITYLNDTEDVNAITAAASLKFSGAIVPLSAEIVEFLAIRNDQARIVELEALADPELLDKYELLSETLIERDKEIETLKKDLSTLQNSFNDLQALYRSKLDGNGAA